MEQIKGILSFQGDALMKGWAEVCLNPETGDGADTPQADVTPSPAADGAQTPAQTLPAEQDTADKQDAAPQTQEEKPENEYAVLTSPQAAAGTELGIEPQPQENGKPSIGIIIGIIVLIAAALAVLTAVLLKKRKDKKAPVSGVTVRGGADAHQSPAAALGINVGNASHIGSRENQQDSFGLSNVIDPAEVANKGALAIVADGMGGLKNGADVSAIVVKTMLASFDRLSGDMDPDIRLLTMVQDANRQVNVFLKGNRDSGSTVVAALIHNNMLYTISVGDSRIYLLRGGALMQLNREHTYGVELDEKAARGDISYEAAKADRQRHALTSYVGMGEIAKIDRTRSPLPLKHGDRVVLMSDGVFGTLTDAELTAALSCDAQEAAARVERSVLAKNKPKQDNLTVVVLQIL